MYIRFNGFEAGGYGPLLVEDMPSPEDDIITSRTDVLGGDGQVAGNDYLRKSVWNISLLVNTFTYEDGMAMVRKVRDAWLDSRVRQSRELAPLYYSKNGRDWFVVYGRPTNYGGPPQGTRLDQGVAHIELQFEQLDMTHYSEHSEEVTIPVAREASGGLQAPVRVPVRVARSGGAVDRWGTNSGEKSAPVTLRFNGPVSDPEVELQGCWLFKVRGSLAWDEYLIINPDPTNPTATIYSTTSNASRLAYSMIRTGSRFTDLVLPPGQHSFTFRAIDPTYTASMTATWPHTYASMQ